MLALRLFGIAVVLAVICSPQSTEDTPPTLSKDPLTPDQIVIYRTFLENYIGAPAPVHLANRTEALDPSSGDDVEDGADDDADEPPCLKRLKLEFEKNSIGVAHMLDPNLAIPGRFVLVDPDQQEVTVKSNDPSKTMREGKSSTDAVDQAFATGLLTLSEIVFDRKHHVAVMSFSFWCGRTCGHGAVVIFKKKGGQWKISKKPCVQWIS